MTQTDILDRLNSFFSKENIPLWGIADTSSLKKDFNIFPKEIADKLNRAVSFGYVLSNVVLESLDQKPNPLYTTHYHKVNQLLDQIGLKVNEILITNGFQSLPIPASQVINWNSFDAHLSHRDIAYNAGLGFIGRSNLLVNPKYGAQVRYCTVLTDAPLTPNKPTEADCGSCRACIDKCPAQAIGETSKDFNKDTCLTKLKEFAKMQGVNALVCGICIKACKGKR